MDSDMDATGWDPLLDTVAVNLATVYIPLTWLFTEFDATETQSNFGVKLHRHLDAPWGIDTKCLSISAGQAAPLEGTSR